MKRFKRNRKFINPFPIIIVLLLICCFISVISSILSLNKINELMDLNNNLIKQQNFSKNSQSIEKESITHDIDQDLSDLSLIKQMTYFGFSSFIKNCPESDEIRPITNQCLQNFGFQSTVFESLEPLYILNLAKSFNVAKEIVLKYFKKSEGHRIVFKNSNLIRSELYDRAVASLIGIFLISQDQSFLSAAKQLVSSIMQVDSKSYFPYSIINLEKQQGFERDWENGTSISDIVSGLPEILSLYKITKEDKYLNFVTDLLEKLRKSNSQLNGHEMFAFYNSEDGQNRTSYFFNERNANYFREFYESLLRSYYLIDLKEIKDIIPSSILSGKNTNDVFFDSNHFSYYINSSAPKNDVSPSLQAQFNDKFEFDATFVRNNLRKISYLFLNNQKDESKNEFENKINEYVINLLDETENKCKSLFGYSGLSYSSNKKQRQNNIQHSSFFGNWINTLSYALEFNITFWNRALFSTRGHLLYL